MLMKLKHGTLRGFIYFSSHFGITPAALDSGELIAV